jgi:hypothetical protein
MGVIVKPKNLNDRQMKRVDRIEESNPDRAFKVADRISARRDARGAENPQIAKAIAARRTMAQPMKKGGKIIKKAQNGGTTDENVKSKQLDMKQLGKKLGGLANNPLFKKASEMKDTTTRYKKAKSGGSFPDLNKDGKITKADILKGRGVIAKKGAKTAKKMMKNGGMLAAPTKGGVSMQLGSYTKTIGKNYTGKNVVNKGAKAKMGKSMGKCKYGC